MDKMRDQSIEKEKEDSAREEQKMAVPASEPDLIGRGVLRGKRVLTFFFRPLWKGLSLFLAPLWKPFQKGADKITRRDWALFLGMAASIALLISAPMVLMKIRNTHRPDDRLYSILAGEKYYWEDVKFEIDENNQAIISDSSGNQMNVSGQPFYYEERDAMFWPFYGVWCPVEEMTCSKIDRFSEITYDPGKGCGIQMPDGSERHLDGFLYDNQDTYVFLEDATITYNGQTRGLAPLSYVRVHGNGCMDLYYYGQEEGELITLDSDPEVKFSNGSRIDLEGDIMYYPNGIWRLLFVALEYIDPLTSE